MNYFLQGFHKAAQEELATGQTAMPQTEEQESDTAVTCVSDCSYAQNPEKRCMLKSITMSMTDQGVFACGQYEPTQQQEMPDVRNRGNQAPR